MREKILKQLTICTLIVLTLFVSAKSGIPVLEKGAETVLSHMSSTYTAEDVKDAVEKSRAVAASAAGKAGEAVNAITGKPVYGEPIDEAYEGNKTFVYAVAGGQVTAVGENEEIGKYVKIFHGNQAESLYGNLYSVKVSVPSNVKKGQIIGVYAKEAEKDFYYSLKEKE